ncbi:signal peptidase II [Paenarthrobacter sp. Z7-10]|uniref:signal peptidase II n=1 Tax=Paenarthrobacter sp. Z7-10 TaxID=2787635 RepID=UPI0022A8FC96|nr:signal peptidase II [Paenarthrobacter sp. Z7-10]MCZ2402370.1 signal peptidase II [Paenarthrobacter sp. Z7-10]
MNDESTPGLSASVPSGEGTVGVRRRGPLLLILAGFALLAYALDQLTKWWVTSTMVDGQVTPVLGSVLSWHYIRNSGAAFSIGENITWVFTLVMAAVVVGILIQARRLGSIWWSIALGMLLGGALGNLTDRLFREPSFGMGHVVDFIALPHFAIFNVADSSVVGSVILICILTLKGVPLAGRRAVAADGTGTKKPEPEDRDV